MSSEQGAIKAKGGRGLFDALVYSHKHIKEQFFRLVLEFSGEGAEAFGKTKPGQFAQIDLSKAALPAAEKIPQELADAVERKTLLRRPFSFCDVRKEGGKTRVEILYGAVGPSTLRMTTLSKGDSASVIGPLGNGFSTPVNKKTALLVVGGMGAGPLLHLAKIITTEQPDMEVVAFAGAKTKWELPFEKPMDEISQGVGFSLHEFAQYGVESLVATDDGSVGYKGFITDCFSQWLGEHNVSADDTIIYSCGPEQMLARIAQIARDKKIDCQVSMERRMACGIGICQSCVVECKVSGSKDTVYKLCCEDGPVFDSKEVVFNL